MGGCVTAPAAWASGPSVLASRGHGAVDVVEPVAPPGRASGRWGRRSVHRLAKMGSQRRSGAFVYTVASRGSRERPWGTQECTQIGENGLSTPFWGICVHCCDAGVARADGGGKGVYTDRRKRPLDAVLGHLCTLLRRGDCASGRWGQRSVHRLAKMASRRRSGAFVYTVATRVASGGASGAAARLASSSRRQPTHTSMSLKVINASLWEKRDDR